jgi:hypothetical protein
VFGVADIVFIGMLDQGDSENNLKLSQSWLTITLIAKIFPNAF